VVIVEHGKPVGIISRGSFLRFIGNYLKTSDSVSPTLDSRAHLFQATDSLMSRLAQLRDDLKADPDELMTPVVCGVSSNRNVA